MGEESDELIGNWCIRKTRDRLVVNEQRAGVLELAMGVLFLLPAPFFYPYLLTGSFQPVDTAPVWGIAVAVALTVFVPALFFWAGLNLVGYRRRVLTTQTTVGIGGSWFGVFERIPLRPRSDYKEIHVATEARGSIGRHWEHIVVLVASDSKHEAFACYQKADALKLAKLISDMTALPVCGQPVA